MADSLKNNMVGAIAYTLKVDDVVIDEVPTADPIEYLHGHDNIIPGLETALEGKRAGDTFSVVIQPVDGYGEYDEENIDEVEISEFEGFDDLEAGMEVELIDEDGDYFEATVLEVRGETVLLDFNSPLAGKTLQYDVEVMDVRPATEAEIEMGLPESLAEELFDYDEDEEEDEEELHNHD